MSYSKFTSAGQIACLITSLVCSQVAFSEQKMVPDEGIVQIGALVKRALDSNPEIESARSAAMAARLTIQGASMPLHNPELEMAAERTDINSFTLSLSQTFDWHDKQTALEGVALAQYAAAVAEIETLRLKLATELLDIIGKTAAQSRVTYLSQQRTSILGRFVELAEQRYAAGDISQSELELARLSLAQTIMQHASFGAELIQLRSAFFQLSGETLEEDLRFPEQLPAKVEDSDDDNRLINNHPALRQALQSIQISRHQIVVADAERKVDPAFSVSAGREDDESLIGLSFSIPLQLRNNFNSQVDVARAQSLQAEQQARTVFRNLQARIQSARQRYRLISNAWSLWLQRGSVSLSQQTDLLEAQWRSGEMNTSNYLQQIEQTLDTRIASVELRAKLWSVWIEWLSASGTTAHWFNISE
jgi:cobalt-zinc-cadmium efflux system outer membrane protein